MAKFCPTCGKPLQYENAEICPSCGTRIQPPQPKSEIRSPFIAVLLSFFFAGWGQWYNGKTGDGLKFFGSFLVVYVLMVIFTFVAKEVPIAYLLVLIFFVIALGIWIYGMYDAYKTAERINKAEVPFSGKSRLFWLPLILIILAIVITIALAAIIAAFVFGMAGNVHATKVVAATVDRQGSDIVIIYQGGMDADQVSELKYGIGSATYDWPSPQIGDKVTLPGSASGKDHVIVNAFFTDGNTQVILDTYI